MHDRYTSQNTLKEENASIKYPHKFMDNSVELKEKVFWLRLLDLLNFDFR